MLMALVENVGGLLQCLFRLCPDVILDCRFASVGLPLGQLLPCPVVALVHGLVLLDVTVPRLLFRPLLPFL